MSTPNERYALKQGLQRVGTKDPFGILTDDQWDELHADLAEMARLRRRAEMEAAWLPMA